MARSVLRTASRAFRVAGYKIARDTGRAARATGKNLFAPAKSSLWPMGRSTFDSATASGAKRVARSVVRNVGRALARTGRAAFGAARNLATRAVARTRAFMASFGSRAGGGKLALAGGGSGG